MSELSIGFLIAALVVVIVVLLIGIAMGWNAAVRRFGRRAAELTGEVEQLSQLIDRDPARMGIDIGKHYATNRMRETLAEIEEE